MRSRTLVAPFNPNLDQQKLDQAILFFLERAQNHNLGKTKLMKLLYFADFDHFEQFDRPITGARYRKLDYGPVPEDAWEALENLERSGRISSVQVDHGIYVQHRAVRNETVNLSAFSESEISVLEDVARTWFHHTAKEVSDAAHAEAPWLAVKFNQEIPYYLAYYRNKFGEMDLDDDAYQNEDESQLDGDGGEVGS